MANIHEEEVLGKAYDRQLMGRLLEYLRPYSVQVTLALTAIVLKAGADVLGPYLTKVAVDKYLTHKSAAAPSFLDRFLSSQPLVGIGQIGAIFLSVLCIGFLLEFAQTYLMQWTGQKVMFDLRSHIFRHLQKMHVGFFDKNPVGRLVTRVTTDIDALNEMFTAGVVSIFEDVFVLAGIIVIMLLMDWRLALITFAVLPFIFVATMIFRKKVRDSYRRIRTAIARINSYIQEHVSGIVPLQLFNRERRAFDKFEHVNAMHMDAFKDAIMAHAVYYPVVETLSAVAIASVIWYGGGGVMQGAVKLGVLVAFMQYAQRFFRPIQDLSEKYNILQSAMASAERVFKLLDTKAEVVSPEKPKQPHGPGRIEFDHVWFAYRHMPKDDKESAGKPGVAAPVPTDGSGSESQDDFDWVLRDVSFTLEPGETVAVVGHTGAGKTTLISLLLRFYDVQKGAIRVEGVDIRELDLPTLRRRFGVVLQDPFLFSGTVEDNIRLGSTWIDDDAIERAADEVNLTDFIHSLPDGFKETVRERGSTLSTGQKQLISFARALAHNPKILILDEATSSVDTETEFKVREALTRMVEGRTSLIIAHRLSTVQRADKIVVMHKGKVREMGSHQQLLANRGIYYKLYQLQYKDQELAVTPAIIAESGAQASGISIGDD
ncbi:MAG TPA: ABC transporter ATP-binding protein [Clostridia bacterium]|nr:ABC transporter ATP-binding protein [Clostridia bacterium]